MGMGFLGKPVARITIEANGQDTGTTRDFDSRFGGKKANVKMRHSFDVDAVSVVKPDQEALSSFALVPYTGKPLVTLPEHIATDVTVAAYGVVVDTGCDRITGISNAYRKFRYISNTPLAPATRKIRYESYDGLVKDIIFTSASNNSGNLPASNSMTGVQKFGINQFPHAVSFTLNESYATQMDFIFNSKIKYFELSECLNLATLNGKLPPSVVHCILAQIGTVSNVNSFLSLAVNIERLLFGHPFSNDFAMTGGTVTGSIVGVLSLGHLQKLRTLLLGQNLGMTSVELPASKSDWEVFQIQQLNSSAVSALPNAILEEVIASPPLKAFVFHSNAKVWARTCTNTDFGPNLVVFATHGNSISGDVILTAPRPNIKGFLLGNNSIRAGLQQNSHRVLNLAGLTHANTIDASGCNCEDIELPANTVIQHLFLQDNKLDIVTSPNLLTQINAMTSLVTLSLSQSNTQSNGALGQTSANGIGLNPPFNGLVNLTTLRFSRCKARGQALLAAVAKLISIECHDNPDLTGFANLASHASTFTSIAAEDCSSMDQDLSFIQNYNRLLISKWLNTVIDISGRTATSLFNSSGGMRIRDCLNLLTIILPAIAGRFSFAGQSLTISGNPLLNSIVNIANIGITSDVPFNIFNNTSLNIPFPFSPTLRPARVNISNNALSAANVDTSVDNYYAIRALLPAGPRSFAINGAGNASPSGIFQAPNGFVAGSSDGNAVSPRERLFVLQNNHGVAVVFNP